MTYDFKKDLNPAQWEAVRTTEGPVLVIAGAGSGKTRTIVFRLAYLVDRGAPPDSILLLTFTRKAAAEMQGRAARLLNLSGLAGVAGGTFHSFAYGTLRRYAVRALGRENFTVMDRADAEAMVREAKDRLNIGKGDRSFPKKGALVEIVSKARNKELPVKDLVAREYFHLSPHADEIESIAMEYETIKRDGGLLDYDDLLFRLENLLVTDEEVLQRLRSRYRYLMVDEYQDTNLVQARLVRLLAGESGNVMAVGDDAQSIYAFRGANVYNILSFPEAFPGARVIRLERNYRSTQPILDLTNAILAEARAKYDKELYTERKGGETPRVVRTISDRSQAGAVVSRVLELEKKYPLHDIAVIFRAGYHSYPLEVALNKIGIPFQKFGGIKFAEAAHIKDSLAYLRLAANPADLPSWRRVLSFVKGVGPKTAQKIHAAIMTGDRPAMEGFRKRYPELGRILDFLDGLRQGPDSPPAMLEQVVDFYRPALEDNYPDDYPRRQAGLEQLLRIASEYSNLDLFLAEISLENPEEPEARREDTLVLSTAHSAKGLEWSAVMVIDLVEDRFPSKHALNGQDELEEERRLLYVACTRARESLSLFVPGAVYNQHARTSEPVMPSQFIAGLPDGVAEQWRENYAGGLGRCGPSAPCPYPEEEREESAPASRAKVPGGYVRHTIFGRGKIIGRPSPGKVNVNFPGFGPKIILEDYLEVEE
jgi:DNA helicase-2/ATP-dependent DNA helicase PcrA